jgi:hypothetical protein
VGRLARDDAGEGQRAGLGADQLERGRLGDQAGGEVVVALQRRERAEAAVLLRGHGDDDHVAARLLGGGRRVQRRRDPGLHVDRPAPVEEAFGAVA